MKPIVWGVLGAARIALERVIPAMRSSESCDVRAIASRDAGRAAEAAEAMGVPRSCGSYEELLADPAIEAVYNPLPNHLHVEWSIRALEAGKHVLCEKPIACSAAEVAPLIEARDRTGLLVEEAVMVRDHPQWFRVRELLDGGRIGMLRNVQLSYSHFNDDPADIRNRKSTGGGSLLDVGSYCCAIARLIFDAEPLRAMALIDCDPRFGTDRFATALLEFAEGHASFFCSMRSSRSQVVQILGTAGWMRAEVPFAHPPDLPARLLIGSNVAPGTEPDEIVRFEPVNQYRLQAERFGQQIRGATASRWPLETSVANMCVLDAIRRSGETGRWEPVSKADAV
ncbi:MAG: Gfo/Idh/MocA family oxidoreductase [Gammaproteobacteria bacterium]|nr:Gfo/Idh/MocA family oxidoreductase [Gammaproteobacteria bacterium]